MAHAQPELPTSVQHSASTKGKPAVSRTLVIRAARGVTFISAVSLGFAAMWWVSSPPEEPAQKADDTVYSVALRGDEPQLGSSHALVTVIEFIDFRCKFCIKAAQPLRETANGHESVRVIFKHYPGERLVLAGHASCAAWAAHQQGKFWEVHDWLLVQQGVVDELSVDGLALGLDVAKLLTAMESQAALSAVADDREAGRRVGVSATPTFFVNGRKYVGSLSANQWEHVLNEALADASAIVSSGVPRSGVYEHIMTGAVRDVPHVK